jgi:hypothetical protein
MSASECATCGMLGGKEQPEFIHNVYLIKKSIRRCGVYPHPHALCLLVKAWDGDTTGARRDLAFIIDSARSKEPVTEAMIDRFLRQVDRVR